VLTKTALDVVDPDTVISADTGYIAMTRDHMLGIREILIDLVHWRWSSSYTIQKRRFLTKDVDMIHHPLIPSYHYPKTGVPIKDAMNEDRVLNPLI